MFLSILAAASDDRSPGSDWWFQPVPYRPGSFQSTFESTDQALRLTAVLACVRVLSQSAASLPFLMYRNKSGGGRDFMRDHWLYRLIALRPNRWQNPFEFREMLQAHAVMRGNGFARIFPDGQGGVAELVPLHPDRLAIELIDDALGYRYVFTKRDGTKEPLSRAEVFHIRGLSTDGVLGLNPIAAAREALSVGLAAQAYGARYFDNDARPGGWIESPMKFPSKEERVKFREAWQEMQGGGNRGKTAILEGGMQYHQLEVISNDDAQFLETRQMTVTEVARLFGVPPHMIADLTRATFSNIEQQTIDFVMHSLTPWLVRWEEALKFHFLDVDTPTDAGIDVEFPTRELLRGDTKARSEYYASGIVNGYLTRNEARIDDGREPLPGLDEPLVPLNMAPASDQPDAEDTPPDPVPEDPAQPPKEKPAKKPAKKPAQRRAEALAAAAAARVARKECAGVAKAAGDPEALNAFFDAHQDFVAKALAVDVEIAHSHCVISRAHVLSGAHSEAWATGHLTRVALLVPINEEASA